MSEFKWEPDKDSEVTGSVTIGEITVEDRLDMGMKIASGGQALADKDAALDDKATSISKTMSIGIKLLTKYAKNVDLKHKETGAVYKSINDMQVDIDAHGVLLDMSSMYLERIQVGKLIQRLSKGKSQQTSEATV